MHKIATLTAARARRRHSSRGEYPQRTVVLTFDDGYDDAATVIAPLLARYGARATFFVNAGTIGHPQSRELARDARHARGRKRDWCAWRMHHLDLSTLDRAGQMHEAGDCVARIERYIGFRPVSYAYASGAYNATTMTVMRAIGIRISVDRNLGRAKNVRDPYEMPRLRITRDMTVDGFAALVTG